MVNLYKPIIHDVIGAPVDKTGLADQRVPEYFLPSGSFHFSQVGLHDGDLCRLPSASEGQVLKRGATQWEAGSGGNGGVDKWTELSDTPSSFTGAGGKLVKVKLTEDGLEFIVQGSGGGLDADKVDGAHKSDLEATMDTKISDHAGNASAHHTKTTSSEIDHGSVQGLSDDDHPQYLPVDGSRAMNGDLDMEGHSISGVLEMAIDTINERTSGSGVTIDGFKIKDGTIDGGTF